MTFIPCFTKASQIALPIPELAPVTKAFLFAQREIVGNAMILFQFTKVFFVINFKIDKSLHTVYCGNVCSCSIIGRSKNGSVNFTLGSLCFEQIHALWFRIGNR